MPDIASPSVSRSCWFVGAAYGDDDQAQRFIDEGIWVNGYKDGQYADRVNSVRVGDRIAVKSTYTRKHDLPFKNHERKASVMAIKAVGTVTENAFDGRHLRVHWDWSNLQTPREWYFYTHRSTIQEIRSGNWKADALLAFTLDGKPQDFEPFLKEFPESSDETIPDDEGRFAWESFYADIANKLLSFRHDRRPLIEGLHAIAARVDAMLPLNDKYADGSTGPLRDICPFTTIGAFNRGITDTNRKAIAKELADFLDVEEPVPESFEGVPLLNNQKSWFFRFERSREPHDIDAMWDVFAAALKYDDDPDAAGVEAAFISAFDTATQCVGVRWNLTFGLYWCRPFAFLPLDSNSRRYVKETLGLTVGRSGHKGMPSGTEYVDLIKKLHEVFLNNESVVSFPELSAAAWQTPTSGEIEPPEEEGTSFEDAPVDTAITAHRASVGLPPYTVDDILADGCFLPREEIDRLLARFRSKKNLILQGPPGTGKTWLARKLAYALMGRKDDHALRILQFHPNMSYEDFVRGWRPSGDGRLELVDGPLMETITAALKRPDEVFVLVIEEINRGNPAQIFGEILTLIEADKRTSNQAIELCHRRTASERVHVPPNVYLIGTMNIADRSLALVDFALRRRFAFITLEPCLDTAWRNWVAHKFGVPGELLADVEGRMLTLNQTISADPGLGKAFCVGHSFVTPPASQDMAVAREWFLQVFETEVGPLLREYWFDAPDKADNALKALKEGF